jgi:dihydropyrimidine dehydrogenase (NAD+) subunit PreA
VLKSICINEKLTQKRYGAYPHIFPVRGKKSLLGIQNYGPYFTYWPEIKKTIGDVIMSGRDHEIVIIPSVIAEKIEEWVSLACHVEDSEAETLELDLSCPVIPEKVEKLKGAVTDLHPELVEEVVQAVCERCRIPVIAKLGPNLYDLTDVALAAERGGARGIAAVNTVLGLSGIDIHTGIPVDASGNGKAIYAGLSGDLLRPIGLRCVAQVASAVKLPIFGIGGIVTWQNAVEYLMVGATALQVCTEVMLKGFGIVTSMLERLSEFMTLKGYKSIQDFRGKSLAHIVGDYYQLNTKPMVAVVDSDRCKKCWDCVVACADGSSKAISSTEDRISIDKETCIGCGLCSTICSHGAIKLEFRR